MVTTNNDVPRLRQPLLKDHAEGLSHNITSKPGRPAPIRRNGDDEKIWIF